MRPTRVLSLLLSPMLLVASAVASPAKTDAPANTPLRVSTGIIAPELINPESFHLPADQLGRATDAETKVVLSLNVDEKGNPSKVRVVKSANPELDSRVVTAILQSRFRPATLNNQSIPMALDLTINVKR